MNNATTIETLTDAQIEMVKSVAEDLDDAEMVKACELVQFSQFYTAEANEHHGILACKACIVAALNDIEAQ
jgi:hypothetical protein